jgi:hypothetical protein
MGKIYLNFYGFSTVSPIYHGPTNEKKLKASEQ